MGSNKNYTFDTHPLIWYFTNHKRLSPKVKAILDQVFQGVYTAYLPSIVLLETFHLSLRNKTFIFPKLLKELRLTNIVIVPLDKAVLSACYQLPRDFEIHNRVIAATAKVLKSNLVTKDKQLQKFRGVKTVW